MLPRILVLLLLVLNATVALWWAFRAPPAPPRLPATDPGVPGLSLLREVNSGAAPRLAEVPDAATLECLEIGPFPGRPEMERAFNALTPLATRIQFREDVQRHQRGWWVYLPAPDSREAALAVARDLSAHGLRDYYVVTAGSNENTVSLGLFRERDNAEKRRAEVREAGYAAEIAPRIDERPEFWISLEVPAGDAWRSSLQGYSGVDARPLACQ
ncbi:MAG: SPOR domain-containing protein [Xanthomonadales bacterium]|nr:SPOR domain-containing protein [Xanthomonadales bacterium]